MSLGLDPKDCPHRNLKSRVKRHNGVLIEAYDVYCLDCRSWRKERVWDDVMCDYREITWPE